MPLLKIIGLIILFSATTASLAVREIDLGIAFLIYAILLSVIPNED